MNCLRRVLIGLWLTGTVQAAPQYPAATGWVYDGAQVLSVNDRSELDSELSRFHAQSTREIAVAIVPSLEGVSVEEYASQLFQRWGIGKKGKDDGVLLLVAMRERKLRIEVGYGLEPILPDGRCGEIIRNTIVPQFKEGRPSAGIVSGVRYLIAAIQEVPSDVAFRGAPLKPTPYRKPQAISISGLFLTVFLSGFAFLVSSRIFTVAVLCGTFFSGVPAPIAFILGALAFWFRMTVLEFSSLPLGELYVRRRGPWGGFGGGFGGGGGWGGGGGFGGFGGGSSGGGGASGGW